MKIISKVILVINGIVFATSIYVLYAFKNSINSVFENTKAALGVLLGDKVDMVDKIFHMADKNFKYLDWGIWIFGILLILQIIGLMDLFYKKNEKPTTTKK